MSRNSRGLQALVSGAVSAVIGALVAGCLSALPALADESSPEPRVGAFHLGDSVMGGVSEQSGALGLQVSVLGLAGVLGEGLDVGMSYHQDLLELGDVSGLGTGWSWSWGSRVLVDGDIRVVTPSGGLFEANESEPSGLAGYPQTDLVFRQQPGSIFLGGRDLSYSYALEHASGVDYFNSDGLLIGRADIYDNATFFEWDSAFRLVGVTDNAGVRMGVVWDDGPVRFVLPPRGDGVEATAFVGLGVHGVENITNPAGDVTSFAYDTEGLLSRVAAPNDVASEIRYTAVPTLYGSESAVASVVTRDERLGSEVSRQTWETVGDNNYTGFPVYGSKSALFDSGDSLFRYVTRLSDGATAVEFEFNSVGVLVVKRVVVADAVVQEQSFSYPGSSDGRVPRVGEVPANFSKPTSSSVTFRDGSRSRMVSESTEYDERGRIVSHTDVDGTVTTTRYDETVPNGRAVPFGLVLEHTVRGTDGLIERIVNTPTADHRAVATTTTLTGTEGALSTVFRVDNVAQLDGFVSESRVVRGGDERVTRFSRHIDSGHLVVTQTDRAGASDEQSSSVLIDVVSGLTMETTDVVGRTARSTFDAAGRVVEQRDGAGRLTKTVYGDRSVSVTDPRGVTRVETTDAAGRVVEIADNVMLVEGELRAVSGAKRVLESKRYEGGHVIARDIAGVETVAKTDALGRPVSIETATGLQMVTEYDDVDNTTATGVVDAGESGLASAERMSTVRRDDSDREVARESVAHGGEPEANVQTRYDGLGRVVETVNGDRSNRFVLNPDGSTKEEIVTPASGEGAISSLRDRTNFGVSERKTISGRGEVATGVSRRVDAFDRTVEEVDQAGGSYGYAYTPDGLVNESVNAVSGVTRSNSFDPQTRALISTSVSNGDGAVIVRGFEYDPLTGDLLSEFDAADRAGTELAYRYDAVGNVVETRYPDGKAIQHRFDAAGRPSATIDVAGNVTELSYNAVALLAEATQKDAAGTVIASVSYMYDDRGRLVELTRSNGVITRYTFTSVDQIATEVTTRGDATVFEGAYEYDAHSNVTRAVTANDTGVSRTVTHAYNAYDQLTGTRVYAGEADAGSPERDVVYEVGVTGNVLKETTTEAGRVSVREFEYNALGQTVAVITDGVRVEQEYDSAGNVTRAFDGTAYSYDLENRPLVETRADGLVTEHEYWANGKRRATIERGTGSGIVPESVVMGMYWDGATLLNETYEGNIDDVTSGSPAVSAYLIGASRHSRTAVRGDANGAEFYVTDRHGSTQALTNQAGAVSESYTYTDYGVATVDARAGVDHLGATRNGFQYAGEYTSPHGDQYLGDRTYNPELTSFTTRDTADQFNLYAYANANPIILADPTGESAEFNVVTDGVITGIGFVLAGFGLWGSLWSGVGWGIHSAIILAGINDLVVMSLQVADAVLDQSDSGFMGDASSAILGWTALGVSAVAGLAGGISALGRFRADRAVAREVSETAALVEQRRAVALTSGRNALPVKTLDADGAESLADLGSSSRTNAVADKYRPLLDAEHKTFRTKAEEYDAAEKIRRDYYNAHGSVSEDAAYDRLRDNASNAAHVVHKQRDVYNGLYREFQREAAKTGEDWATIPSAMEKYNMPPRPDCNDVLGLSLTWTGVGFGALIGNSLAIGFRDVGKYE